MCDVSDYLIIGNQRSMKLTRIVKIRVNLSHVNFIDINFHDVN